MSLRIKIALIGLPLFLVLFAALHITASNVLVRSFDAMEADAAGQQAATVLRVLANTQAHLTANLQDWSGWDDTYRFVQDHNPEYVASNLSDTTFLNLKLSAMVFVNTSGRVVHAGAFDLEASKALPLSPSLARFLRDPKCPLLEPRGCSGILALPEGLMLVCSQPILTSERRGPSKGTLIFARCLTATVIKEFRGLTNTDLRIDSRRSGDALDQRPDQHRLPTGEKVLTKVLNEKKMEVAVLLRDIQGRDSLVLTIPVDRTIHRQGVLSLRLLDLSLALVGIAFCLLSFLATERLFLRRLTRLQGELEGIRGRTDLSKRMTVTGRDEMSSFSLAVNELLDGLQQYECKDRAVLEALPDIMMIFSPDGVILDIHVPDELRMIVPPQEYLGKSAHEILDPETADAVAARMKRASETGEAQVMEFEIHPPYRDEPQQYEARLAAIGDGSLVAIMRNITERKKAEANMRMQISAMNAAGDQIVISNAEGLIQFVNAAFERATGYARDEVVGRNARTLVVYTDANEHMDADIQEAMLAGRTWHGEVAGMRKDGTPCPEDVTITPVLNEAGVVEHCIAIKRDITQQKMYEARLDLLAHHDALTGLPNRLLFSDRLNQRIAEARRRGEQVAVMFLDMDRFKRVNDTLGHNSGDRLLTQVAERLKTTLREADTVARMGGDEFTVVLSQRESASDPSRIARRILEVLARPFHLDDHELYLTASIGISVFPSDGSDVETLVRNADAAMYHAKEHGENTFHFYTEALNIAAVERMTLESALRKAVERDELLAYYQPCVDIRTGGICGVKALARWRHPDLGIVTPDQFIPLAEETGLIVPIGEWMLRRACEQNKSWQDDGLRRVEIGVNISAKQFQFADLAGSVKAMLSETGLSPEYLVLELTESALMLNPDHAVRVLRKLKKLGVKIFIDDFGTGYSSLSHLKRFPIDAVKIDRSFICDISTDADDAAIAGAVIAMAHSLKLKVIAEGVETLDQLESLRSLDCDQMQGYFVSRPAPAEDLVHVLASADLLSRDAAPRSAA